jgi:hypothetical protein
LKNLSKATGHTKQHLQRMLDRIQPSSGEVFIPKIPTTLILDATFFGRSYGFLVARIKGKNIHWKEIDGEKIIYYRNLLDDLKALEYPFSSFAIDGRRGVKKLLESMFPDLPIQHCQFHQKKTIINYISTKPRLESSKELLSLVKFLTKMTEKEFSESLEFWYLKWKDFLKEKTENIFTGKKHFTHKRLRSAYFSLKRNMPYLFTYLKYPELNIPNTTNSCDGSFAHWKNKVKIHRGLRKDRRKKMIDYLLSNSLKSG